METWRLVRGTTCEWLAGPVELKVWETTVSNLGGFSSGEAQSGLVWPGLVWFGSVWYGLVPSGLN